MGYDNPGNGQGTGDLTRAKLEAEIDKLRLEAELLKGQTSKRYRRIEFLKALSGLGGVVVTLSAVVGGGFSIVQWLSGQHEQRLENTEKRLDEALKNLAAKDDVGLQLSAISSLKSFMHDDLNGGLALPSFSAQSSSAADRTADNQPIRGDATMQQQVMVALATALTTSTNETVQDAIVDFIRDEATQTHLTARNACLQALANANRSILRHNGGLDVLLDKGASADKSSISAPEPTYGALKSELRQNALLAKINKTIQILVQSHTTYADFSGTFLPGVDFSGVTLAEARFNHAVLDRAIFREADLKGASFDTADLAYANFIGAHLEHSRFTYQREANRTDVKTSMSYVERDIYDQSARNARLLSYKGIKSSWLLSRLLGQPYFYSMPTPDFRCSHLDGADFSGSTLMGYFLKEADIRFRAADKFLGATVVGTDFSKTNMVTIDTTEHYFNEKTPGPVMDAENSIYNYTSNTDLVPSGPKKKTELSLITFTFNEKTNNISQYKNYNGTERLYNGVQNWKAAKWPVGLKLMFEDIDRLNVKASNPDVKCDAILKRDKQLQISREN